MIYNASFVLNILPKLDTLFSKKVIKQFNHFKLHTSNISSTNLILTLLKLSKNYSTALKQ